jgi:hypothetical protein
MNRDEIMEADVQKYEYPEAPTKPAPILRKTDAELRDPEETRRRQGINAEVVEALMGYVLTQHEDLSVLIAIVDGRIPHVSISY